VTGNVELLGIFGDDWESVDVTLESHGFLPSEHVGQSAVQKLIETFGIDVAIGIDAQHVLREVLRGLTPNLPATGIAIKTGVVAGTI
jgi:hypothetical protein